MRGVHLALLRGGLLLWLGSALAQNSYPLAQLEPGLVGYGLTAGPGNAIGRFEVEVLGLLEDGGLGFPLVLVRASGDLIEAAGGVAAGMSGSPVYLPTEGGEALLGAVSYVFPNSDHRLAMLTPAEVMRGAPRSDFRPTLSVPDLAALGPMQAVATPLLFSGLSARASARLGPLFEGTRLEPFPVQQSGFGGFDESGYLLEPGSAVSVQLVRGDVTIAAVGTLTSLEADGRLLAFGHPLLGAGEVSYALAPAFVTTIVPSQTVPFKLANNGQRVLGVIDQDRPAAVAGILDAEPDFLAVSLNMTGPQGSVSKSFEVTRDERFYAPLLAAASLQLLDTQLQQVGAGTSEVAWDIRLESGSSVRTLEQVTHPSDLAGATASLLAAPLQLLAENAFQAADVQSVAISLSYSSEQTYADIARVVLETDELAPGQPVVARVRLQPYRGEPRVETLTLNLPPEARGELELRFWGGLTPPEREDDGEAQGDLAEAILSFGELLAAMRNQVQSRELVVETTLDVEVLRLARLELPFLVKGEAQLRLRVGEDETELLEREAGGEEPDVRPETDDPEGPELPDSSPPLYP